MQVLRTDFFCISFSYYNPDEQVSILTSSSSDWAFWLARSSSVLRMTTCRDFSANWSIVSLWLPWRVDSWTVRSCTCCWHSSNCSQQRIPSQNKRSFTRKVPTGTVLLVRATVSFFFRKTDSYSTAVKSKKGILLEELIRDTGRIFELITMMEEFLFNHLLFSWATD